jgi:hypothetical protein
LAGQSSALAQPLGTGSLLSAKSTQSNACDAVQLRDLEAAIAKLPPEQREVILLVGLEGMLYEHVASILRVPIGTVRSRLFDLHIGALSGRTAHVVDILVMQDGEEPGPQIGPGLPEVLLGNGPQ